MEHIAHYRKDLNADSLYSVLGTYFKGLEDPRSSVNRRISLSDILMSSFALFSLKYPSLLQFEKGFSLDENLSSVYGVSRVPSDTCMRSVLDELDSAIFSPLYKRVLSVVQGSKGLEAFSYLEDYYLLSVDGTGYFSSTKVHCPQCLEKRSKSGVVEYSHQMLGACMVHPDLKEVLPLCPEPIIKQDGSTKNDCERNASKRLIAQIAKDHPTKRFIFVEDSLYGNAPHINLLESHRYKYIIAVKEGDHKYLFEQVEHLREGGKLHCYQQQEQGLIHQFEYINQIPLNASNEDLLVNLLVYKQIKNGQTKYFTWITNITLKEPWLLKIMRAGRARWKIENETFNTLKNQGYQFEHNFGHGYKNLSVNLAMMMMLAFLIDQIQQLCCKVFNEVWKKLGSKKLLWYEIRKKFEDYIFDSMLQVYQIILNPLPKIRVSQLLDSS